MPASCPASASSRNSLPTRGVRSACPSRGARRPSLRRVRCRSPRRRPRGPSASIRSQVLRAPRCQNSPKRSRHPSSSTHEPRPSPRLQPRMVIRPRSVPKGSARCGHLTRAPGLEPHGPAELRRSWCRPSGETRRSGVVALDGPPGAASTGARPGYASGLEHRRRSIPGYRRPPAWRDLRWRWRARPSVVAREVGSLGEERLQAKWGPPRQRPPAFSAPESARS